MAAIWLPELSEHIQLKVLTEQMGNPVISWKGSEYLNHPVGVGVRRHRRWLAMLSATETAGVK